MKLYIPLFDDFLCESQKIDIIKKKLKGNSHIRTVLNFYRFYYENGYKEITDPKKLLTKLEYYDQRSRDDEIFDALQIAGIPTPSIDAINQKIIKKYIKLFKPGSAEFNKIWLIIQHADNNLSLQKEFIKLHGDDMKLHDKQSFNMLSDRIDINDGKPQRVGISQGAIVRLNNKEGWVPKQMSDIKVKETVDAEDTEGKPIKLLKWAETENKKIKDKVENSIGEDMKKKAADNGIELSLKSYVEHVMDSEYLGPYMIKI